MRISDWSSDVCSSDRAPPRAGWRDARAAPVGGRTWSWRPSYRRLAGEGQPPLRRQSKGRAGWSKGAVRQKRDDSGGGRRLGHRPAPVAAPIHRPCHRQRGERGKRKAPPDRVAAERSEEHTSELQSLMRISYAVFCLKKKKTKQEHR